MGTISFLSRHGIGQIYPKDKLKNKILKIQDISTVLHFSCKQLITT